MIRVAIKQALVIAFPVVSRCAETPACRADDEVAFARR